MAGAGLFWLTRDFRLYDNEALCAAIKDGPLLAVFVIDRQLREQGAASRWRLRRALAAFDAALSQRGGRLTVLEGEPETVLPDLAAQAGAARIHQTDWPTPRMRATQARLRERLQGRATTLELHAGHLLTRPGSVRTGQGGMYRVYTPFARALRRQGVDAPGPDAPARITAWTGGPRGLDPASLDLAPDLRRGRAVLERFALPAGEQAAHDRLDRFLDHIRGYPRDRDRPDLDATSNLSEHLATGEIGPRTLWARAMHHCDQPGMTEALDKFLSELIWREFAWHMLEDFPDMASTPWRPGWQDFPWRGDNPDFTRWCRAETGIALVDAGLRQMRVTGRMQNRVRMVAASWLSKQLLTDWRLGLAHYADSLTDWDPASNALNWQWVAGCGPDAAPFFRVFNPQTQAERFDPDGDYRAQWLAGWRGQPGPEAAAYAQSVPPAWGIAPDWRKIDPLVDPARGRQAALDSYRDFRQRPGRAPDAERYFLPS